MDEKDWNILTTLYKERNITKTAERLYISQPALTYRIKQLEKEFNTIILSRGKRGVDFTVKGEYLVEYSKDMLLNLRKAKERVLMMDKKVKGPLRLGASGMFARYQLPPILKIFLERYPEVEINLKTGWSSEITQLLQKEEVHLGIVRGDYNWQGRKDLYREEKIVIASSKKIELSNLPSLPRINYMTDLSLKNLIDNWWQDTFKAPPLISMEVDRIDTCKQLVLNGMGYAILPSICIEEGEDLYTLPIHRPNNSFLLRETWIIYRESTLELTSVNAFIDFLNEIKI